LVMTSSLFKSLIFPTLLSSAMLLVVLYNDDNYLYHLPSRVAVSAINSD
jgi:hypothetical protein